MVKGIFVFSLSFSLVVCNFCIAKILNVPSDYPTIQQGIDAAENGDSVLVECGTYSGEGNTDINFYGKKILLTSEAGADTTFIDCQNKTRGFIFLNDEDSLSIVNGFSVINGNSEGDGAGIYILDSSPLIINCEFKNNVAQGSGGAAFVSGSSTGFRDCSFTGNLGIESGGGIIFLNSFYPSISGCNIEKNSSYKGGGVLFSEADSPKILNSFFKDNISSFQGGGGILFEESFSPEILYCSFQCNSSTKGGGIFSYSSDLFINHCQFYENLGDKGGGGIYCSLSSNQIINSLFIGNSTYSYVNGGGICIAGELYMKNCVVKKNNSGEGGGIYCGSGVLENSSISENNGAWAGGGIACVGISLQVSNCKVHDNFTAGGGGGIYARYLDLLMISNCFIYDNFAGFNGSGIQCDRIKLAVIRNSTISQNSCISKNGAGIGDYDGSDPIIINCILWKNFPKEIDSDYPKVQFSDIKGGFEGIGNIDADPMFADPEYGNFHLLKNSPCIDTGRCCGIYTDIDGNFRPYSAGFDMGADEWTGAVFPVYGKTVKF